MTKTTIKLEQIQIASPCSVPWESMDGNDRQRFCRHCQLNVYNITDMTEQEATTLIENTEGRLCVRLHRREDGTVLTKDCPVGLRAVRNRIRQLWTATLALAGMFLGAITISLASRKESSRAHDQPLRRLRTMSVQEPVMGSVCIGKIALPPPTPVSPPVVPPGTPLPADGDSSTADETVPKNGAAPTASEPNIP